MKIEFYPYDFEYKVKENKVLFYLYAKYKNKKIQVIQEHRPFFYAQVDHVDEKELARQLQHLIIEAKPEPARIIHHEIVEKELLGKKQKFWKIFANFPKAVPIIAKELQAWGIQCYEKDILFTHRYLRDQNLTPMCCVEAEGEFVKENIFLATEVKQKSLDTTSWKILAFDLETYSKNKEFNPEKNPILMAAFYGIDKRGNEFKKVITWQEFAHFLDHLEVVEDEAALIRRCQEIIKECDPEILTGYFSDGFDLPYLKKRAEKHKIKLEEIKIEKNFRSGNSRVEGILHLDVFKFVRNIFGTNLKTGSYDLNSIAQEILGYQKHKVNLDQLSAAWDENDEKLADFCEYNEQDARLTWQLCPQLLPDMIEFTKIISLPLFDVIRMRFSRLVENYILKRAGEFNVLAPNKPGNSEIDQRMQESIQGAFVFEPIPGLYERIMVFDFRSLYPSIITAHNIGPESFRCPCCLDQEHVPEREEYWFCRQERKFLPSVLEYLIVKRAELKKEIRRLKQEGKETKFLEARSYAFKILANSFYGYLGFFGARWYSLESAASTTAYARNYIKETIKEAEEKGFQVIYADTDSCFLLLKEKKLDDALNFMKGINDNLPEKMELEFEGYFPSGIFVAQKGSLRGAKKKYALMDKEGQLKITGFEFVRKNWSILAKEVQREVLSLILSGQVKKALSYVKETVENLKKGKILLDKLIIRTQITRELSQYTSVGPHVLVAQRLAQQGEPILPGAVVEYIIMKGSGLVRERARTPQEIEVKELYDADYYLYHQLLPAISSIFAVLGYNEDYLLGKGRQTGLGSFF